MKLTKGHTDIERFHKRRAELFGVLLATPSTMELGDSELKMRLFLIHTETRARLAGGYISWHSIHEIANKLRPFVTGQTDEIPSGFRRGYPTWAKRAYDRIKAIEARQKGN